MASEEIDINMLEDFIKVNYKSKLQFSKELDISYSHLSGILKGEILIGNKTKKKLNNLLSLKNLDVEDFIIPTDIILGNIHVKMINITSNGEILCSISSRDIIEKDNIKVEFIV